MVTIAGVVEAEDNWWWPFDQDNDSIVVAPDNKGGEISTQATAGDVPAIEMMPHKSSIEFRKKVKKQFKVNSIMLHPNKSLKEVNITIKNRSEASKKRRVREFKDYRKDEFYVSEAKKFLAKYSKMFGIKNIEKNILTNKLHKNKRIGNSSLSISISLSGYLVDKAIVNVRFSSDDTIRGARIELPQITPDMVKVVRSAKTKALPLEEVKKVAGKNFVELAIKKGWLSDASSDEYEEAVRWNFGRGSIPKVIDKSPYIFWEFVYYPIKPSKGYKSYVWSVDVDVATGKILNYSEYDTNIPVDAGTL